MNIKGSREKAFSPLLILRFGEKVEFIQTKIHLEEFVNNKFPMMFSGISG